MAQRDPQTTKSVPRVTSSSNRKASYPDAHPYAPVPPVIAFSFDRQVKAVLTVDVTVLLPSVKLKAPVAMHSSDPTGVSEVA